MMRFLGNIEAKIDSKGRAFLPAVFRKQLQAAGEEVLVLRQDIHGKCLVIYPESSWNKRLDAIASQVSEWDEDEKMVLRNFMSEAEVIMLDGNGRFLVSRRLLQSVGIEQGIRFIGMNDTIEIWAAERSGQSFLPQQEFAARLKNIMGKAKPKEAAPPGSDQP